MKLPTTVKKVLSSILGESGHAAPTMRQSAFDYSVSSTGVSSTGTQLNASEIKDDENLTKFVEKVIHSPYRVINDDFASLKANGLSEDEIFELIVATAVGAGTGRLQQTLSLLEKANEKNNAA